MCILVVMYMDVLCIGVRVDGPGNDGGRAACPTECGGNGNSARREPRPPGEGWAEHIAGLRLPWKASVT